MDLMMSTNKQGGGQHTIRYVVVGPPAVGGCMPKTFCRSSPRSVLEGLEEVEVRIQVLDPSTVQNLLCPDTHDSVIWRPQEPALLWVESSALSSGFGHVQLSFKLRDAMRTCRLPLKPAKIFESRRSSKSDSIPAGRAILSPKHYLVLTQVHRTSLPSSSFSPSPPSPLSHLILWIPYLVLQFSCLWF